jgi:hypothetical protein
MYLMGNDFSISSFFAIFLNFLTFNENPQPVRMGTGVDIYIAFLMYDEIITNCHPWQNNSSIESNYNYIALKS